MLPIDRTAKSTLDTNLVNGNTSDAPAVKNSNDMVYNTIDELNAKVDGLVSSGALSPYPPSFLSRQSLINGNFDVWQRGTSFTNTGGLQYFSDRWSGYTSTLNQACTISKQDGSGVSGNVNCLRFQRNSGQTGTNVMVVAQSLETIDSKKLLGKKLTLSFWARIGSGSSSSSLATNIVSGTGTDQNVVGGFTGAANEATLNANLTTNWQKFTLTTTSAIASTKTGLAVQFSYTPAGTAGANDYFEITQVQLNSGDQALPFQPKSYTEEDRLCRRYFRRTGYGAVGRFRDTVSVELVMPFESPMRVNPTITLNKTNPIVGEMFIAARTGTGSTIGGNNYQSSSGFEIVLTGFTGGTSGNMVTLTENAIDCDSEL